MLSFNTSIADADGFLELEKTLEEKVTQTVTSGF